MTTSVGGNPSRRSRVIVAAAAGVYAAMWPLWDLWINASNSTDFDQIWTAARALLAGLNPYAVIGPGLAWEWAWPFYYPLPAAVVALPLALLPLLAARMLFVGLSGAALAWAVTRDGWERMPLFLSASFIMAARAAQWSPLLVAAATLPALAWLMPAKPNIALALWSQMSLRSAMVAVMGGGLLALASFAFEPGWVGMWLANVRQAPHFVPLIRHPAGLLLLLALLRWKRREAWLLLSFAVIPHTAVLYSTVPLFLIPQRRVETLALALASGIGFVWSISLTAPDTPTLIYRLSDVVLWCMYLPCLVMLLVPQRFRDRDGPSLRSS